MKGESVLWTRLSKFLVVLPLKESLISPAPSFPSFLPPTLLWNPWWSSLYLPLYFLPLFHIHAPFETQHPFFLFSFSLPFTLSVSCHRSFCMRTWFSQVSSWMLAVSGCTCFSIAPISWDWLLEATRWALEFIDMVKTKQPFLTGAMTEWQSTPVPIDGANWCCWKINGLLVRSLNNGRPAKLEWSIRVGTSLGLAKEPLIPLLVKI